MASAELYTVKQQFILGAFKSLISLTPPPNTSNDYLAILLYQARAHLALNDTKTAQSLLPSSSDNVAVKAALALTKLISSPDDRDSVLDELRDLAVEVDGDEDVEGTESDKATAKVLLGTAFARSGEVEEALETLGSDTEDLEAVGVIVSVYLSINRADLAKKEFERSKRWAEDDLLLQLIESNIGLVTGKDNYANTHSFYTEQLANPSLTSPHLLTARGVTRLLRGEIEAAKSDLEESIQQHPKDAETQAAYLVATELSPITTWKDQTQQAKLAQVDELYSKFAREYPSHPLVGDLALKAHLFDDAAAQYVVPTAA